MRRLLVAVLLVLLVACGDDDAGRATVPAVTGSTPAQSPSAPDDTTAPTAPATTGPAATTPATGSSSVPMTGDARAAIADLAARQNADPNAITIVAVENVTWRTSAVGCPQKGMQYLQVLTDGVRIVLELDGRRYQYHAGGGRSVFYCPTPEAPVGE